LSQRLLTRLLATLLLIVAPLACGPRDEKRMEQPALSPEAVARQALDEYDTNKDGVLSGEELDRCAALKNSMEWLDTNKDGKLSAEEIAERIRFYQESKVALLTVVCQVTLDDKPLPGATLTFVPEKFMGPALKPASGVSDAYGKARLSGPEPSGVSPGFYKVEVSLKDTAGKETLPARYNSQTVLGQEVGPGMASLKGTLKLTLTSD
jgi:EF hand